MWTYTETKNHNLEISPFYIKNAFKMYVEYKKVKLITKKPKVFKNNDCFVLENSFKKHPLQEFHNVEVLYYQLWYFVILH